MMASSPFSLATLLAIRFTFAHANTSPILGLEFTRCFAWPLSRTGRLCAIGLTLLFAFLAPSLVAQKNIEFADKNYEAQIKTALLYPNAGDARDYLYSPVSSIENQNLVLEFDDLQDNRNNYYVKLIHCNYDWTKSNLMDLDFLDHFNENPITEYAFSIDTHTRYVHYRHQVQPVKLPGNYILIVYRDSPSEIVLSKRMMIYQNQVVLTKDNLMIGSGTLDHQKQQFNFDIDYSNAQIINPLETVHVAIRQNQRWDNAKSNLQPNFYRENANRLEYRFFKDEDQFYGGNEFRFVDFRSLNFPGQNTGKINKAVKPYELSVALDVARNSEAYALYPDLNGNFLIENLDVGEPALTGNYAFTTFFLKSPQKINGEVYLIGGFNSYVQNEDSRMHYNPIGYYESRQFLKQGLYNYQYAVRSSKSIETQIEGSHYQTENTYEVFVYNRPFRPNADLLIGYYLIPINPR
jgi:Domain of unknown function (DUF5103)